MGIRRKKCWMRSVFLKSKKGSCFSPKMSRVMFSNVLRCLTVQISEETVSWIKQINICLNTLTSGARQNWKRNLVLDCVHIYMPKYCFSDCLQMVDSYWLSTRFQIAGVFWTDSLVPLKGIISIVFDYFYSFA